MNPRINSEVSKGIAYICGHPEVNFVPMQIVMSAELEITPETLARKLRDCAKVKNGPICKCYYQANKGLRVAIYRANKKYKEKTKK